VIIILLPSNNYLLLIIDPKNWDKALLKEKGLIAAAGIDILDPRKVSGEGEANNKTIGQPDQRNGLYTIKNGANRISDCPMANTTL
jgi:hypothetical protein